MKATVIWFGRFKFTEELKDSSIEKAKRALYNQERARKSIFPLNLLHKVLWLELH